MAGAMRQSTLGDGSDSTGLVCEIEKLVAFFGPDARQMIKSSMEEDRRRTRALSALDQRLRQQGDFVVANRVMRCARQIWEHSWSCVIPLRRSIKIIAEALFELQGLDALGDPAATRAIVMEISVATDEAVKIARSGEKTLHQLEVELRAVVLGSTQQQQEHALQAKGLTEDAWHAGCLGFTSLTGGAASLVFAPPIAMYASIVLCVGGLGFLVYALLNVCSDPKREDDVAVRDQSTEETVEAAIEVTKRMAEEAQSHKKMWEDIGIEAKATADAPFSSGTQEWDLDHLRESGEQLLQFVQIIDEYLFWLSQTEWFPPNFDIQAVIGSEACSRFEQKSGQRVATRRRTQSVPSHRPRYCGICAVATLSSRSEHGP